MVKTRLTLKPGQRRIKRLAEKCGDGLLHVDSNTIQSRVRMRLGAVLCSAQRGSTGFHSVFSA